MNWIALEIDYLDVKDSLLERFSEKEFEEFIECEDCCRRDFECLIDELERQQMYERVVKVHKYIHERYAETEQRDYSYL